MKNLRFITHLSLFLALVVAVSSCDEKNEELVSKKVEFEIENIFTQTLQVNNDIVTVKFAEISLINGSKSPDGLYINGKSFMDNGKNFDKVENDGIFTSVSADKVDSKASSVGDLYYNYSKEIASENSLRKDEACTVRIYLAGEDGPCGVCPSTSILGGDTWFCVCVKNCADF